MAQPTIRLRELPWLQIHRLVTSSRVLFFQRPKPSPGYRVWIYGESLEDVIADLANQHHYEDGSLPSYRYHGEDANLRCPIGRQEIGGQRAWMQNHARFFVHGDGRIEVLVHTEPSAIQNPRLHIREQGFSWQQGVNDFKPVCRDLGYDYSVITPVG